MLSKRNYAMMMTIIIIVLVLFLSSAVLKEYFNDYDVNHAVDTELIDRMVQEPDAAQEVLYLGSEQNGYFSAFAEWAEYRRYTLCQFSSLDEADALLNSYAVQQVCLLMDGELLADDPETGANTLAEYVKQGGVVIFYRLPSYNVIKDCGVLQDLLGIQRLRGESVTVREIWLFDGFLLGGETHYLLDGAESPELADMDWEVPWYDISSRTKTYMVGFLSEEETNGEDLHNEDMPAIIWRSNLGNGAVFAVNGDYMKGETALGILDAMLYEASDYALYPVVNAQNLCFAGFPDLTVENEETVAETYGMTTQQFCRDILWPYLVASIEKGDWKGTAFLSLKQSDQSMNEPNRSDLIDYLKFFNEESTEAGISLGRIGSTDICYSVADEQSTLESWGMEYVFAGGYVRQENRDQLTTLLDSNGQMKFFQDIRTVVGEYEPEQPILSWLTDRITLQNATTNAYKHSNQDNLRLKSLETALGYSNIMVDIYSVLWPEKSEDRWENVAEKMASNVDTYWKPFAAFDKTTISESDSRVRNFLNGKIESVRNRDEILIQTTDYTGEAYLLLRTHGETPETMIGGTWEQVESDTYLLVVTSQEASVILKPTQELYYQE